MNEATNRWRLLFWDAGERFDGLRGDDLQIDGKKSIRRQQVEGFETEAMRSLIQWKGRDLSLGLLQCRRKEKGIPIILFHLMPC